MDTSITANDFVAFSPPLNIYFSNFFILNDILNTKII